MREEGVETEAGEEAEDEHVDEKSAEKEQRGKHTKPTSADEEVNPRTSSDCIRRCGCWREVGCEQWS